MAKNKYVTHRRKTARRVGGGKVSKATDVQGHPRPKITIGDKTYHYAPGKMGKSVAGGRKSGKSTAPDKLVAMPLAHPVSKTPQQPVKSLAHPVSMRTALDHPISKPTYNGLKKQNVAPPMPRTKIEYGTPKAAAAKLHPKTTMSARTPPNFQATPTKEFMAKQSLGSKIRTAFAANKGNNERLAKERMLKASRK